MNDSHNAALTYEEWGVHIALLCRMWDQPDCTLPNDDRYLARLLRVPEDQWRQWREVLVDGPYAVLIIQHGKIVSPRLYKEWLKVKDRRWRIPLEERPLWSRRRQEWNGIRRRLRALVFQRDGQICRKCGTTNRLEIDHIHPLARGGTNKLDNLQVLCRSCNARKWANEEENDA